jgi:hypothetical protein
MATQNAGAQKKFEYRVKAGVNIGGTSPMPLPAEIRKIKSYSPTLALSLGGEVLRNITDKWAVQTGITFETKGMSTQAQVKNYQIAMTISDGDTSGRVSGPFTGSVKTTVRNSYLSLPLLAVYRLSPRWRVNAGMFVSVLMSGGFDGKAFDGYIRDGDPIGEKIGVSEASYDFSDEIRRINWGGQCGARWQAYRHFSVYGDLTIAANSIFKRDFDAITFDMYNVYLNMGFAYTF